MSGKDFGWALKQIKASKKVARKGWNGKKMYIFMQAGSTIKKEKARNSHLAEIDGDIILNPHIDMKTADGSICIGWLASQTDIFAEDWFIVE